MCMSNEDTIDDFPRDAYLKLLHGAQRLFSTEQERRNLLAGLQLASTPAERQTKAAVRPELPSAKGDDRSRMSGPVAVTPSLDEADRISSPASFALELVELMARKSSLDASVKLARRAIAEIGPEESPGWAGFLEQLETLQRKYRATEGEAPDVAGYREWLGFDCRHPYSLTDRFVGRQTIPQRPRSVGHERNGRQHPLHLGAGRQWQECARVALAEQVAAAHRTSEIRGCILVQLLREELRVRGIPPASAHILRTVS